MNYHTAWQQIVTFSLIFYPTYWNQNNGTLMLHWGMSTCDWDENGFNQSTGGFYKLTSDLWRLPSFTGKLLLSYHTGPGGVLMACDTV